MTTRGGRDARRTEAVGSIVEIADGFGVDDAHFVEAASPAT